MAQSPINLNKARKAKMRSDKRAQADANAVRFGRSKAEKSAEKTAAQKAAQSLDGHKRE